MSEEKWVSQHYIEGLCPIVAVPFSSDGEVDWSSFKNLILYLSQQEMSGLVLFGLASEFYKLSDEEKLKLTEIFLSLLKDSPIKRFISVTEHSSELAVRRAKFYTDLGADGLMLLPPHFLNPDQEAVIEHVVKVALATSVPIVFQYAPNETGFFLNRKELQQLTREVPDLIFKIESNPPMKDIKELLQVAPGTTVLNGYAGLYMLEVLQAGGVGVMPGCSFLEIYARILKAYGQDDREQALALHTRLVVYLQRWMSRVEYIIGVEKRILHLRGIIDSDYCRSPSYRLTLEDQEQIKGFLLEFEKEIGPIR